MSSGFSMKMEGLEKVLHNIAKIEKNIANGIDDELATAAKNIEAEAVRLAPKGKSGRLRQMILAETNVRYRKTVIAEVPYAAYVEFGTGSQVFTGSYNFTKEQRAYARQFYVNGKGRSPSRPYLFPSFEDEKPRLLQRIKKVMFK